MQLRSILHRHVIADATAACDDYLVPADVVMGPWGGNAVITPRRATCQSGGLAPKKAWSATRRPVCKCAAASCLRLQRLREHGHVQRISHAGRSMSSNRQAHSMQQPCRTAQPEDSSSLLSCQPQHSHIAQYSTWVLPTDQTLRTPPSRVRVHVQSAGHAHLISLMTAMACNAPSARLRTLSR
ncbi:hypothetical protein BDU57DRAFT_513724 [Ampelomyces quisqualis]|uniref:Uncharacterized protein n=1 Tax=Ampelomyces quisqualis TaxID=50730 RepID=A0A6A5QP57_AMPQU|nr:hypothetical protein BDU57DRAFT_513724 [Ampelomyces quisqualis]